jgi:ribosomal protein S27E
MTERYRYALNLECPDCRNVGVACAAEDDLPLDGVAGFSLEAVSTGFQLMHVGASFASSRILCLRCGKRAREFGAGQIAVSG